MLSNISRDVTDFLKANHVAVLATANGQLATPHAAAVFYATDSHMNLYFLTKEQTAKSQNIQSNPQVALVIFDTPMLKTAQITGKAMVVQDDDMMQRALELMNKFAERLADSKATPLSKLDAGGYILYKVVPQSIRLWDYKYGTPSTLFDIATPAEESLE